MFNVGKGARKTAQFIRNLLRIGAIDGSETDPQVIKAQIPRSWWTKTGPGRVRDAKRAFAQMSPEQRKIALDRGWFPRAWAKIKPGHLKKLAK